MGDRGWASGTARVSEMGQWSVVSGGKGGVDVAGFVLDRMRRIIVGKFKRIANTGPIPYLHKFSIIVEE